MPRASRRGQERNQIQPLRFDRLITSVCNATKDQRCRNSSIEFEWPGLVVEPFSGSFIRRLSFFKAHESALPMEVANHG